MSSKSKRKVPRKQRHVQQRAARTQGKRWPPEIEKTVRDAFTELHTSAEPVNDESAKYAVPVHWTAAGVTMWKAFVTAAADGKEAAVGTALLTNFLQRSGWVELCRRMEIEVLKSLGKIRDERLIEEAQAAAELTKIRTQLLNNGVMVEDSNAEQEASWVENAPSQEEERAEEGGNEGGEVEGNGVAVEETEACDQG